MKSYFSEIPDAFRLPPTLSESMVESPYANPRT